MIGTAKHLIKILVNYTSFRYDEKAYRESETLVLKPHAKHEAKDASMALRKVFGSDYVHRLVA